MDRLLNMILNILLRRGINGAINAVLRRRPRGTAASAAPPVQTARQTQTPPEAAEARRLAARARQAARLGRKL